MNTQSPSRLTPDQEWRETIHLLINASAMRYPDLAKHLKVSLSLIKSWGKGEDLEKASLQHYVRIIEFFLQERCPMSDNGLESWTKVARYFDSPYYDHVPHVYLIEDKVLCNRAYLISRIKAVGLTRAKAAELLGTSIKFIRWATDESKEPGEMFYISTEGYRRVLDIYGKAWYDF